MNVSSLRTLAPKLLLAGAVVGGGALLLAACGGPKGRKPEDIATELLYSYDKDKTGADQAKTGERSLSNPGEHRIIVAREQIQDSGYYSDNYRKFDEVRDISHLIDTADTNDSGDATQSELTAAIRKFDGNGDGVLDRMENADYEIEFAPKLTEVNVRYDRDLNGRGQEAVAEGIVDGLEIIFGGG
jgi:hypothetical protein